MLWVEISPAHRKDGAMSGFPPISVRQPQPYDLVDDPVRACGIGTGFEGQFAARVRDGHGAQIAKVSVHAGVGLVN